MFVLSDYHYHQDEDGDLVPAAGEKSPGGVAKEIIAMLRILLHYLQIQQGRHRFNKENYLAACFDVLSEMNKWEELSQEERHACEAAKAAVANRADTPSPYDAAAIFYNAASAPEPELD